MNAFELFGIIAVENDKANGALDETSSKAKTLAAAFGDAFNKCGSLALSAGKTIAKGLAAGVAAMTGLTVKSLNLSGELEQNLGGSEAVYKEYASNIQGYAAEAFSKMGLSQSNYLATANKMGALFQGVGFSIEESANISASAMQRAADVASIMGIDVAWAMESIAGAAKGNFTMMDNLGVAINETALANYALEKGIKKSTAKMSTQEKVALAMELFMERTAYATGNYAKENETLAGSLTTAKAALDNFLAGSGSAEALADSFVNASKVIIKNVNNLLPALVDGANKLVDGLLPYIPTLFQSLLPGVVNGAVNVMTGLATALPGIAQVLVNQVPLIASQISTAIQETAPMLLASFKNIIEQIDFAALGENIGGMFVDLVNRIPELLSNVGNAISYAWSTIVWPMIQGLFQAVFGVELPDWDMLGQTISENWSTVVWPAIQGLFYQKFEIELPDWETIKADAQLKLMELSATITSIVQPAIANLTTIFAAITAGLQGFVEWITSSSDSADIFTAAVIGVTVAVLAFKAAMAIKALIDGVTTAISAAKAAFALFNSTLLANPIVLIGALIAGLIASLVWLYNTNETAREKIDAAWAAIKEIFNTCSEAIQSAIETAIGVINSIKEAWENLKTALTPISTSVSVHYSSSGTLMGGGTGRGFAAGAVFSKPTFFNTRLGSTLVGEGGESEAVAPISVLQGYVSDAVASQNAGLVTALDRVVDAINDMNDNMGSNLRSALDDTALKINNREFGRLVRTVT